jgi:hypothetical protein
MSKRQQLTLRIGRLALEIPFLYLCVRFQIASFNQVGRDRLPLLIAVFGCIALGGWVPKAALFAFTAAIPLLSGLSDLAFLPVPAPLVSIFISIYSAASVRRICEFCYSVFRGDGNVQGSPIGPREIVRVAIDLFIAVILASLVLQIRKHWEEPALWSKFWTQPVFGFRDPFYFLTSSFLWLGGLFYFQWVCELENGIRSWIIPILSVWVWSSFVFFGFQYLFHVPESTNPGFSLPYEDISSFGSISVALLVYLVASLSACRLRNAASGIIGIGAVLFMVVASWSRAAWLAAAAFFVIAVSIRLPRRWTVFALVAITAAVCYVNINLSNASWRHSPYLSRLSALALIENPANKSRSRLDLYHKAFGMIEVHPIVGFGIGSFDLTSRDFARPGDPLANVPDFAHDVWLQLAAELGIPIASMCVGIFAWALIEGYRNSRDRKLSVWVDLPRLGVTLALASYLLTQVTANSLNVYESNQFICWFLVAAAAQPISGQREERGPDGRTLEVG